MAKEKECGIWISPTVRKLMKMKIINCMEGLLLAHIEYLENGEGCFASNSYYSEELGISTTWVSVTIAKLRKKKLIVQTGPNNKKRHLKVCFSGVECFEVPLKARFEVPLKARFEVPLKAYNNKENEYREIKDKFIDINLCPAESQTLAEETSEILNGGDDTVKKLSKAISSNQTGFGLVDNTKKKSSTKKSEFPLSEFDKEQGVELRTILVEQGSDLVTTGYKASPGKCKKGSKRPKRNYSKAVTPETLAENFYLLRKERNVSEKEIMEVMEFLSRESNGQFTPKVYAAMDLYNKWERFRDAVKRSEDRELCGSGSSPRNNAVGMLKRAGFSREEIHEYVYGKN